MRRSSVPCSHPSGSGGIHVVAVMLGMKSCQFCAGPTPAGVTDSCVLCICAALIKGILIIVLSVFYDVAAVNADGSRATTAILLACRWEKHFFVREFHFWHIKKKKKIHLNCNLCQDVYLCLFEFISLLFVFATLSVRPSKVSSSLRKNYCLSVAFLA